MERLWSTIGNLVRMTREMSAERRLTTLCHSITHYKKKNIFNLRKLLFIIIIEFLFASGISRTLITKKIIILWGNSHLPAPTTE